MITPNDIQITSELIYESCGLTIGYSAKGEPGSMMVPDEWLMNWLYNYGTIASFDLRKRIVVDDCGKQHSFYAFMNRILGPAVAHIMVADFLNSRTDKAAGNYKIYSL